MIEVGDLVDIEPKRKITKKVFTKEDVKNAVEIVMNAVREDIVVYE